MVTTGYFWHYAPKTFVTLNLTRNDIGQELIIVFQYGDTGLITGCLKC